MLLDGEGIIFKDEYLQGGEEGGRNAAKAFETCMRSYLAKNIPSVAEPRLLTKIFLNVKSFGELCARSGTISEAAAIHDFIRGFNETMSLSEIVDIGSGKNKTYDKIQGSSSFRTTIESLLIVLLLQKCSKSSFTIAIATRSSWAAPQIVNTVIFWRSH